jgi:hypothetical protein
MVADGMGANDSTGGGVAGEEEARDMFLLRSASGLSVQLFGRSKSLIHYPVFIPQQRKKTSRISLHKLWLPLHACDHYSCHARFSF